ncbi:MAG: sugar phosphate nucleotidyltransferase [Corallococcus sp.]|nr:sugar phosphate nucleotidyltransferase [Corallococcus sp.]MCM1359313.1 sugar phosphate nucleotidyltransferase [Corallococcus sp.]MCM1394876.1 sugar phosphate nucleotidyltransferase [Corallococcus sp.]
MKVNKALILAAGKGTRFLPYTKSCPKEMLAVGDKPALQLLVEEVVASGITDVLVVVSRDKRQIIDYFTPNPQAVADLRAQGKNDEADALERAENLASVGFVYQNTVTGTACAVELAKDWANGEPFAVLNGDDVVYGDVPATLQLVKAYERSCGTVVGVQRVSKEEIGKYASCKITKDCGGSLFEICDVVEKPQSDADIFSLYAPLGRYILTPQIFDAIKLVPERGGGEKYLTDALQLLAKSQGIFACEFFGERFDFGSKLGYLKGVARYAAADLRLQQDYLQYLRELLK